MSSSDIITIARQTVWVIVKTSVPLLLVSMVVGLIISLFQTLTSIQEQTLTFVPKLIAILISPCALTPRCASSLLRRLPVQVAAKKCSFTKALAPGSQHPRLSAAMSCVTFLPHCILRYSFIE